MYVGCRKYKVEKIIRWLSQTSCLTEKNEKSDLIRLVKCKRKSTSINIRSWTRFRGFNNKQKLTSISLNKDKLKQKKLFSRGPIWETPTIHAFNWAQYQIQQCSFQKLELSLRVEIFEIWIFLKANKNGCTFLWRWKHRTTFFQLNH